MLGEGLLCFPLSHPHPLDPGLPAHLWGRCGWGLLTAPQFLSSCYRQGTVQGASGIIATLMGYCSHFGAMTQEGWG